MTETLKVERYDLQRASDCLDCETEIGRDLGGDYVLYDDYWALAHDLATLRAQLAGVREKVEKLPPAAFTPRGAKEPHLWLHAVDRAAVLAILGGAP